MKAMVFSDLITSKNSFASLLGITLFVAVFIAIGTGTLVTSVACLATMVPFMYLFSISAYDEQNGWERFRLTLPITRRQVAYGRYVSMLVITLVSLVISVAIGVFIGFIAGILPSGVVADGLLLSEWGVPALVAVGILTQIVILLAAAFSLPLIMRFGMTKGSRLVPVLLVLALSAGAAFFGSSFESLDIGNMIFGDTEILALALVAAFALTLVLYFVSACISARLYERREL